MELDKFKRRLVRSVSHLMKQDTKAQEVAWEQMQKETTCDCKLLWQRMRGLTIKKLKRLVQVDDRHDAVSAVARLSATDWLLFDLVLVHEKIDVIGRDQIGRGKGQTERATMLELFDLVLEYDVEMKRGENLLEAWAALTREYNSTDNRHCSPMLLQKRWFQLKEMTRANFYKLWNSYRGNQKLWDVAQLYKPTPLQAEIAKKFPQVITQPFPEWEELIQMQRVIVLEQFETYSRKKKEGPKTVDDKPDLVVIEPVIETIDLGAESDDEDPSTSAARHTTEVNLALVKQEPADDCVVVKEEPVEDGLSNVQILETTHIPVELNEDSNSNSRLSSLALEEANRENLTIQMSNFIETTTLEEDAPVSESVAQHEENDVDDIDLQGDLIKQKADEYIRSKSKPIEPETQETPDVGDKDDDESDEIVDDIIKQKADDFIRKVDIKKLVHDVVDEFKLPQELTFTDEGIEFVDDGIEYNEEDDSDNADKEIKEKVPEPVIKTEADEENEGKVKKGEDILKEKPNDGEDSNKEQADSPKFDLKLLMEPVVYTTKLDDMIVFKGKKFNFVQFQNVIDSVVIESKPVSKQAIKVEVEDRDDTLSQSNLSQSSKAASDDLFKNDGIGQSNLNEISNLSQSSKAASDDQFKNDDAIHHFQVNGNKDTITNDDMFKNNTDTVNDDSLSNDSDESEEEIDESLKVKATSCLLQKPRNRSYNPIILCKNPDFNTRLKRLTAGFFSIVRNRKLLSACKPMTIDINKAFESKLVNGTLYLKSSEGAPQPVREQTDNAQSSSVIPSAMPCQSLLSKEKTNIDDLLASSHIDTVDLTQRSKTINLRDLSEIRRINQHLLTAQVPPMRVASVDDVSKSSTYPPQDLTQETAEDTAAKSTDDPDEPKIIGVAGRQDVTPNTLAPEHDFHEGLLNDNIPPPRSYRGRGRGGMRGVKKYGPAKPYVAPFTSTKPSTAPWTTGPKARPGNIDDFLITIDTLNRMINKLDGCAEYQNPKGKNKRPIWSIEKNIRNSLDNPVDLIKINTNDATAIAEANDSSSNIDVPETAVNVSVQTTNIEPEKPSKCIIKPKKKKKARYCCWSKEKMAKYGTNYKMTISHTCPSLCQCCCREDLLDEMKRRRLYKIRRKVQTSKKNEATIVLSDEGTDDSNDVRIPGFDPVEETQKPSPVPKLRVSNPTYGPVKKYTGRGVPMSVAGVSTVPPTDSTMQATITPVQPLIAAMQPPVDAMQPPVAAPQQPIMRINISYAPAAPNPPPLAVIKSGDSRFSPASILEQLAANTAIPTPVLALNSSPNRVNIPVAIQQSTKRTQRQIVIDASGPVVAENVQDRMFYLNSKAILSKPKDSPIFLGKNKILLTTVKFPPNMHNEDKVEPIHPSKVTPTTLPLPRGVNLILMPDGHINFTLDPDVHLDNAQLEVIPKIISAVQQQINSQLIAPTAENASVGTTSVIDSIVSPVVLKGESVSVPARGEPAVIDNQSNVAVQSIEDSFDTKNAEEQTDRINLADVNNISKESIKNTETSDVPTEVKSPLVDTNSTIDVDKVKDSETININENNDSNVADVNSKTEESIKNTETSEEESPFIDTNSKNDVHKVNDSEIISIDENKDSDEANVNKIVEESSKNTETSEVDTEVKSALVNTNPTNDVDKAKDSEIISIEENNDSEGINMSTPNTDINNTVNEGASCSRNLLSDLMEMSGISSEDVPQESAEKMQVAMPEVDNTLISLAPSPLAGTIAKTATEIVPATTGPVDVSQSLPELSPITSLIELKYACQNNGLFFKLDLDTGVLAPINVCIKKNIKPKERVFSYAKKRLLPLKSVIDLTDDGETDTAKNVSEDGIVKPIKLVKRVVYQPPNLIMRKTNPQNNKLTNPQNKSEMHTRKRKQNLEKIEAKIDLVDSDAPMEEEYLVESSDSDTEQKTKTLDTTENISIPDTDSDDSSDDEPLSKKFMRLKENNSTLDKGDNSDSDGKKTADPEDRETTDTVTEIASSVPDAPTDAPVPIGPAESNELNTENIIDSVNPEAVDISDNVHDNIDPDDMNMDIEEAQFLPVLDDNESHEEDCILGF